ALNEAGTAGGAIISYGTATVNSSTFADNSGGSAGGAIVANSGVDVINSTFVGNSTDDGGAGGAIAAFQGAIVQSTFVDNSTGGGDGESLFSTASEDGLTIQGNIFAGTGAAAQVGDSNTVADLGGNIFSTSAANEAFLTAPQPTTAFGISTALLFNGAILADNGGPTQTVALYAGSPAVNFVPAVLASVTVDQRGIARDSRSDAGAFEFPPTLAATGPESIGVLGGAAALLLALGGLAVGVTRRSRFRQ
ncbi:MAG: hypothetical protein LH471_10960, partial [Salinibacterium sp.]|nr:hypothetical protein [Salinibacterium sp.]